MTPLEKFAKEYLEKNPKMTALMIFAKELIYMGFDIPQSRYEKCKEMEKQQIMKAYGGVVVDDNGNIMTEEQYYNDTYNN